MAGTVLKGRFEARPRLLCKCCFISPGLCSTSSMTLEYARGYLILMLVGLTVVRYQLGDFTDSSISLRQLLSAACISSYGAFSSYDMSIRVCTHCVGSVAASRKKSINKLAIFPSGKRAGACRISCQRPTPSISPPRQLSLLTRSLTFT